MNTLQSVFWWGVIVGWVTAYLARMSFVIRDRFLESQKRKLDEAAQKIVKNMSTCTHGTDLTLRCALCGGGYAIPRGLEGTRYRR